MIFKDIDRLLSIEKHGSISKAADELYISRSALTQQMKQLEKELGFTIFTRDHTGICMTEEGSYLIEEMQKIKTNYEDTIQHYRQKQHGARDSIVIGLMPNLKSPFLPNVCKKFRQQHPEVQIRFQEYFLKDYIYRFQAREFDISTEYFYNYIHDIKGLCAKRLATISHTLLVVPDHPLASKPSIGFEDLRGHKLIMYRRGITKSEDLLRDYLLYHEPEITILDIDSYDGALFTRCELESAVLLSYSLYDQSFPQFISVPAAWNIPVHLGFYYHRDCRPAVRDFIKTAENMFRTYKNYHGGSNF